MVSAACGDDSKLTPDAQDVDAPSSTQPKCSDGIDNDGDGLIDFPADPGCSAPQQDDETDDCPSGPHCPQCKNGIDDDGNGSIDYPDDPGCSSASDPTEFINNPVACGAGLTITSLPGTGTASGTLDGSSISQVASTCGGGQGAPAVAYQISLTSPKVMVASTAGSTADTLLELRGTMCDTDDVACSNDVSASDRTSKITQSLAAGNYYLIVSGNDSASTGDFTLDVRFFTGEGEACVDTAQCGPGLVCRIPLNQTAKVCSKPMCSDGVDDDGDGKLDYPTDPGCANPADNDETDPNPLPACANGVDDDGDGMIDYPADTSCTSASANSEACQGEVDPIDAIVAGTTTGTTVGAHDNHQPTCQSSDGGDILYTLNLPAMRSLVLDTEGTTADTVLSLMRSTCSEPGIACDDDGGTSVGASRIQAANLNAGTYIVAVDQYTGGSAQPGPYNLHVTGVISPGGRCGPTDNLGGALTCPAANPCGPGPGGTMICLPSACGDGMDNDGDGKVDYPDDPGCTSIDDTSEDDSCASGPGPNCPECSDGIDNDGDGQIDYPADTNCTFPGQASEGCPSTDGVFPITDRVTMDNTSGANNDVRPSCASSTGNAPDHTYSLQLPTLKNLSIVGSSSFDGVLALYDSTCGGTALACSDPENIQRTNVAAGNYYLVVDGWSSGSGTTTLTVTGTIQNGASCESPLAQSGALVCGQGFACLGTVGSRTCRPAACSDGIDNDGDGVADYPNDPGCASPNDSDESDNCPGGAGCPACSDGVDNDGDGLIDYPDDPGCASASSTGEACNTSENVVPMVMPMTSDTTAGASNDDTPSCSTSSSAPDRIYSVTVPTLTSLTFTTTGSGFTPATSLYGATCGGTSLACSTSSTLNGGALVAGTYYFSVDGTGSTGGAYNVTVAGTIAPLQSCESPLAVSGALSCSSGYACKGTMGARTCQPATCNDGMDNDGDGKTDYPNDPGCTSPSDDTEQDPATPPVCSDGIDNDGDGLIDYPDDFGCVAASSDTEQPCVSTDGVTALTMPMTMDTTVGAMNDSAPSCGTTGTNSAGDKLYSLTVPALTSLTIANVNSFDAAVALYDGTCGGTALQCKDEPETIQVGPLARGTYYYLVDGYSSGTGAYTINVSGQIATGESCEGTLATSGALTCGSGSACKGTAGSRTCQPAACADGMDNDGDGKADYPLDPGCDSASDDDETDPATAPVCSNGMDDDTDGAMDYPADYGCSSAAGTTEQFCMGETNPTSLITTTPVTGTTVGATNDFASTSCQSNATGPDVTYALQLPVPVESLTLDLSNSSYDTVLTLRDTTCATQIVCDDDSGDPGAQSKLTATNLPAGGYAVMIDGYSGNSGTYTLAVHGTVAPGNSCSSPLFTAGVLACRAGTTCNSTTMKCQ